MEGKAARAQFLPFHVPSIGEDEIREVTQVLRSGWLTTGPKTKEFEEAFAQYVGCRHAIAVNSGTAALHLALEAVGVKPGDEVIVPTMTFAATAEVVIHLGATPVLADCERDTFNVDPEEMERKLTSRTRAIIPVHIAGRLCRMEEILGIAGRRDLRVVEDAAHALPAKRLMGDRWRMIGAIGDLTAFSFYATKTITTGEGGMITTEEDGWAERMRTMSLHGISRDAWKRYTAEGSWRYEILSPGYKYNMSDILAAIGLQQLKKCDRLYEVKKKYAEMYSRAFAELEEIIPPPESPLEQHAWHLYVILLRLEALTIGRDRFVEELKALNIGTSVHFIPLHLHPYYRSAFGYQRGDFPNAEWVYDRCLSLPLYPKMAEEDVWYVIEAVWDVVKRHKR